MIRHEALVVGVTNPKLKGSIEKLDNKYIEIAYVTPTGTEDDAEIVRVVMMTKVDNVVGFEVPKVHIIIEGGCSTVKSVSYAVEHGIPCLIVDGSGRAADIISRAKQIFEEGETNREEKLKKYLENACDGDLKEAQETIEKVLKNHSALLTVFKLQENEHTPPEFDKKILEMLTKTNGSVYKQFKLALLWNQPEEARKLDLRREKQKAEEPVVRPQTAANPELSVFGDKKAVV